MIIFTTRSKTLRDKFEFYQFTLSWNLFVRYIIMIVNLIQLYNKNSHFTQYIWNSHYSTIHKSFQNCIRWSASFLHTGIYSTARINIDQQFLSELLVFTAYMSIWQYQMNYFRHIKYTSFIFLSYCFYLLLTNNHLYSSFLTGSFQEILKPNHIYFVLFGRFELWFCLRKKEKVHNSG